MVKYFEPDSQWVDPEIKFIVISNNKTSLWYYEHVRSSWDKYAPKFKKSRFEATVPNTIKEHSRIVDLNFFNKAPMQEMTVWRAFSETEKAVWYSHARLWKRCIETNKSLIIVEHDCLLEYTLSKNLLCVHDMVCLSRWTNGNNKPRWVPAAAAAYYITPPIAKILLERVPTPIVYNVDGWIHKVCAQRGDFKLNVARQCDLNPKIGNTIKHPPNDIDTKFL